MAVDSKRINNRGFIADLLVLVGVFIIGTIISVNLSVLIFELADIESTSRNGMLIASSIQALFSFILPAFIAARFVRSAPLSFLKLATNPGWVPFVGVAFGYIIALPALNQLIYWNSSITFPDSLAEWGAALTDMEENAAQASSLMLSVSSFGGLIVNLAIIALLTALAEEAFFRGAVQNIIVLKSRPRLAIWITAIVFSTMHFQFFGFLPRLLLGAWFGYLLYWTRSLYVPVFAHFLNNGVVVVCSWLSASGVSYDFDRLGVEESGFPLAACVSLTAFIIFIVYFRNFFFGNSSNDLQRDYCGYKGA